MARLLGILGLCAIVASAFNMDIHNQIGFMAEEYLTPEARWMTKKILEPEYEGSIGRAAHWADTVARSTHKYSYTWHWISALDDPPRLCNLYYNRDCQKTGCVVQQIANQTSILNRCVTDLNHGTYEPDIDCQQALKWTLHFIGDVAQPLHTSYNDFGGNTFKVKFNGSETNMHTVWDRLITYAMVGRPNGFSQKEIDPFFTELVNRTQSDVLPIPRHKWLLAQSPDQALYWAEQWAKDSNGLNCDFVYGRYVNGSDLYLENDYAKDAFPILELQIAKAAWRLGGWLNAIAAKYMKSMNGYNSSGDSFNSNDDL